VTTATRISLVLYVAGQSPHSLNALGNLRRFCETQLGGRVEIDLEVVDVLRHPDRALADRVLLTPALVKRAPAPVRRVVGDLSEGETLARALDLVEG
jgi:circadian clock protein KaiB